MSWEIDQGLRKSCVGMTFVASVIPKSIESEVLTEKALATLLSTRRVIPDLHGMDFDDLDDVSPMLASHTELSTKGS